MEDGTSREPGYTTGTARPGVDWNPEICPVRHVLAEVGDKWSILILAALAPGERRFSELKRGIGDISQRMLSLTLRKLERDGYLTRRVTPSVPPRVDYALTPLGRSLTTAFGQLAKWALTHRTDVARARAVYDARSL